MASFALSATTGGACKHAWTKKVGENNGQLRFHLPPRVAQASRLDQKQCREEKEMYVLQLANATTDGAHKPPGPIWGW